MSRDLFPVVVGDLLDLICSLHRVGVVRPQSHIVQDVAHVGITLLLVVILHARRYEHIPLAALPFIFGDALH